MEVVLSQFVESLTQSGLMTSQQVEAFIEKLPPEKKPEDGKTLAQELVRHKKLTKFQAQAVYQGKTKGLTLGDYVVLDRIGQGGMGQVFKARHKVMKRIVALKTLPSAATNSPRAVQRFHREVEVAARLSHPNIVTAHDAGESHGLHYLVMEHVDGDDLATVVKQRGRLTVKTVIDYILQAAKGLEYAHKQKVIHRDIKPSNLLLDREGTIKVLDMGLARLNQTMGPDQSEQETLTGTGQVMGTIDFLPPEQAENTKQADERSDIYSLGCTLYYLITGQAIYSGDTTVMKILAHRETEIPSLRRELPEVSEQLDAIYQKMVAKKPDDRYGSMAEVIAELEKCVSPPEEIPETATFEGFSLKGVAASEPTLDLNMPVISPVDEFRKARPKKAKKAKLEKNHIIYGSIAVGVLLILGLLGVVFTMQTPEGTLIVEVNQADAEISVDDGKVTLKSPSDSEPVEVEVAEGKHTLKITKGGFRTFAREFEITSGGEEVIRVTLVPLEKEVAAKAAPKPAATPVAVSSSGGNWALEFDGKSGSVELEGLQYDKRSHPITIETIVRPFSMQGGFILGIDTLKLMLSEKAKRFQWFGYDGSDNAVAVSNVLGEVNSTYCLAGVWDGDLLTLYVDGQRQHNSQPFKPPSLRETIIRIGGSPYERFHFHGIIDEVRISNIARYTEDFTPQCRFEPDEHTMALYHFDGGSGDVLKDSSGNGHDGKIVGAKWVKVDEGEGVADDAVVKKSVRLPNGWTFGEPVNLGPGVNSKTGEVLPAVSPDGLSLYFQRSREGWGFSDYALWMSTRGSVSDSFGDPTKLENLGTVFGPEVSFDGLTLLYSVDGDLWIATRKSSSEPFAGGTKLEPNVNSEFQELCPELSNDGLSLVFASDRPGGIGKNLDLWMSTRESVDAPFDKPVNLGPPVNTGRIEMYSVLSSDCLTLILSSDRPGGLDSNDLWMFTRKSKDDPFGDPVNLGPPINSDSWDSHPELSADDRTLFYSSGGRGSPNGDIYMASIYLPESGEADTTSSDTKSAGSDNAKSVGQPPLAIAPFTPEEAKP